VVRQEAVVEEVMRVEEVYQAGVREEAVYRVLEVSCAWSGVVVVRPRYQALYLSQLQEHRLIHRRATYHSWLVMAELPPRRFLPYALQRLEAYQPHL
jgi:hypothetical protein